MVTYRLRVGRTVIPNSDLKIKDDKEVLELDRFTTQSADEEDLKRRLESMKLIEYNEDDSVYIEYTNNKIPRRLPVLFATDLSDFGNLNINRLYFNVVYNMHQRFTEPEFIDSLIDNYGYRITSNLRYRLDEYKKELISGNNPFPWNIEDEFCNQMFKGKSGFHDKYRPMRDFIMFLRNYGMMHYKKPKNDEVSSDQKPIASQQTTQFTPMEGVQLTMGGYNPHK